MVILNLYPLSSNPERIYRIIFTQKDLTLGRDYVSIMRRDTTVSPESSPRPIFSFVMGGLSQFCALHVAYYTGKSCTQLYLFFLKHILVDQCKYSHLETQISRQYLHSSK